MPLYKNSTCFGQYICPSSGVFHCTHSNGICHKGLLTACEQDQDDARSPERPHSYFKCITFEHSPRSVHYIFSRYLLKPECLLKTKNLLFARSFGPDAFGCHLTRSSVGPFLNEILRNTSLGVDSFLRS